MLKFSDSVKACVNQGDLEPVVIPYDLVKEPSALDGTEPFLLSCVNVSILWVNVPLWKLESVF